jgi:hypothetical protein
MNYWLTVHWPEFADEKGKRIPDIEVKKNPKELGFFDLLKIGDIVFVYRTKTGDPSILPNGKKKYRPIKKTNGVEDIYTVASGWKYRENPGIRTWKWYANMEKTGYKGCIPRERVNEILGYARDNPFRKVGVGGCKLLLITEKQAEEFFRYFTK